MLSVVRPGDEVIAAADLYSGTLRLLELMFKPWDLVPRFTEDATAEGFSAVLSPAKKLVCIETPTNSPLHVLGIAAIAKPTHRHRAVLTVDNTFA